MYSSARTPPKRLSSSPYIHPSTVELFYPLRPLLRSFLPFGRSPSFDGEQKQQGGGNRWRETSMVIIWTEIRASDLERQVGLFVAIPPGILDV